MNPLIFSLVVLIASSCTILPKPSAVHDFGYPTAHSTIENTTLNQHPAITVEAPRWLSDNRISYRLLYSAPTQVRFYSLDRWLAPPPELFQQFLLSSGLELTEPLTIHLQAFEQQFTAPNQAKVIMQFRASVTPSDDRQKPLHRDFFLQQPCPTADAKGAVAGFTLLAKQAVNAINSRLKENYFKY